MADKDRQRENHILDIIDKPLSVVEDEHGLWGLEHIAEIVKDRMRSVIHDLQENRDKL